MEVWREIVARDGVEIANVLNRSLFRQYLETKFPGRPVCARFELSNETKPTADEIADLAGKLKTAGYTVDQSEIEEAVGLKLVKDEVKVEGEGEQWNAHPFMNKNQVKVKGEGEQRNLTSTVHLDPSPSPVLTAFAKDMSPAGKAVAELLKDPSKEAAEALLAKLDTLLPKDPAMTAVIAEATAKEFGTVELANEIANPCPKCHRNMPKGGTCSFCAKRAANHSAGKSAFDEVAKTHKDKVGAMERDSIGKIDFIWGDNSEGICHILEKHKTTARQIPGVIAYGDVYYPNYVAYREAEMSNSLSNPAKKFLYAT